jgi:hypothetical protein
MIHDQELDQRRLEIEQHSQEFHEALDKLREATKRPLGLADSIREHPLTWLAGALLVGVWLGSRNTRGDLT